MNVVVAGIMGRYPYGGVAWCSLMYLLGLERLGHRVFYVEDTGECNYDPVAETIATDPRYATTFIDACLTPYGFGDRWSYVDYTGRWHGRDRDAWRRACADADLFVNLSGGSWFWRDEYAAIPRTAFIDTDPAFTQLSIAKGDAWYVDFFSRFDTLFTFGRNIGTPTSPVPVGAFRWEHTWQPVTMAEWTPAPPPPRDVFTTIMSWRMHSFQDIGGNKDVEFLNVLDLARRTPVPIELAVAGPREFLEQHGWACRDAFSVSRGLDDYRDYIRASRGEFSVAKHTYVSTRSGWFSDRTACYLASGRPVVVQDTGFSRHLPVGEGLVAFSTMDEARAGLEAVVADYARHARAARDVAESHFASDVVLAPLVERAMRGDVTDREARG